MPPRTPKRPRAAPAAAGPDVTIGYARCSTSGQDIDRQAAQIRTAAAARALVLDALESDDAISGDAEPGKRRGLQAALRRLRAAGPRSTLIVRELSRLGRDEIDVLETARAIVDAGIRLISVAENVDTGDHAGALAFERELGMRSLFIAWEKRAIVERMYAGRMRAKAQGKRYASAPRYGFRLEGGAIVPDDREQRGIRRARALAARGVPLRRIGERLVAEGFAPRTGAAWSTSVLTYMIRGERPKTASKTSRAARSTAFWQRLDAPASGQTDPKLDAPAEASGGHRVRPPEEPAPDRSAEPDAEPEP